MEKGQKQTIVVIIVGLLFLLGVVYHQFFRYATPGLTAQARLEPARGSQVSGKIDFLQEEKDSTKVTVFAKGLEQGPHGLHINNTDDCAKAHFKPHWDTEGNKHASPQFEEHHRGDLGNVQANNIGVGSLIVRNANFQLEGKYSAVGKVIVITEKMDDYRTQPDGNSGKPVACGVIIKAEP